MGGLTTRVREWEAGGQYLELAGRRIFVHEQPGEGTPLLLLHGFPSSSYDWREMLAGLPGRRVVCLDFLGFGLSEKPRDHVYSLMDQADLVEAVAERFAITTAQLVGHDMGTSVATELLARDIEGRLSLELDTVLLFNGSMILERASLTPSQKALRSRLGPLVARLSNRRLFRLQFARIFSRAHPLSDDEAADQWSLLSHLDGHRILDRLIAYLDERVRFAGRWHGALRDWPGRLELAWAMRDPVATANVLDGIVELRPHAPVTRWPELGHYPQLEDPAMVAVAVQGLGTRLAKVAG